MINLTAPYDCSTEDIFYWKERSAALLGQNTRVNHAIPIDFDRDNWSGSTGTVFPAGPTSFTILDVDGYWTKTEGTDVVTMTNEEGNHFCGFKHHGVFVFSAMGSDWQNEDPRIAFAQMMYNI